MVVLLCKKGLSIKIGKPFFVDAVFGTINVSKNFEMLKNIILFFRSS